MKDLDNVSLFVKYDQADALGSTLALADQCFDAWRQVEAVKFPVSYRRVDQIIVAGMGGSNLGARILSGLYSDQFKMPLEVVDHYHLPAYAGRDTLVIASSYSGGTEEAVAVFKQAVKRSCKVMVIATGGTLVALAKRHKKPFIQLDPKFNFSQQPRLGIGYSVFAQLALFHQLGFLRVSQKERKQTLAHLRYLADDWKGDRPTSINRAKQLALELYGRVVIWVASEHLRGNARVANNQTNETAKNMAAPFDIPELNHHLMEGLKHPSALTKKLTFVFLNSEKYDKRVQRRFQVTDEIVKKNNLNTIIYTPSAATKLGEACEVLLLSGLVTYYLAMLNKENPNVVPFVDEFKQRLSS